MSNAENAKKAFFNLLTWRCTIRFDKFYKNKSSLTHVSMTLIANIGWCPQTQNKVDFFDWWSDYFTELAIYALGILLFKDLNIRNVQNFVPWPRCVANSMKFNFATKKFRDCKNVKQHNTYEVIEKFYGKERYIIK